MMFIQEINYLKKNGEVRIANLGEYKLIGTH